MLRNIRWLLVLFMIGLVLSGITSIPLQTELEYFAQLRGLDQASPEAVSGFDRWILIIRDGLRESYAKYPWLGYGTDWLAFAHLVIAILFIGPLRDPVKNIWVIEWGMIACALILPFALIMGSVRGIPFWWRVIDCSFGVLGIIPLWVCRRLIRKLAFTAGPPKKVYGT